MSTLETLLDLHSFELWCLDCKSGHQWFFAAEPGQVKCAVDTFILRHAGHRISVSERAPTSPDLDYTAMGQACIEAIIEGGMIHADEQEPSVLVWNGNAAEQIGEHLRRAVGGGTVDG